MSTTQIHVKGIRPAKAPSGEAAGVSIPVDWIIFNAPRPLHASNIDKDRPAAWRGDFIHGIFYVAVNPADEWSIKRNCELDAWEVIYHAPEESEAWAREYYPKQYPNMAIDWSAFEQHDFDVAFYGQLNKHLRG